MNLKFIELAARYCGHGDWLGVVYLNGRELFRSGKHLHNRESAFNSAVTWAEANRDICEGEHA